MSGAQGERAARDELLATIHGVAHPGCADPSCFDAGSADNAIADAILAAFDVTRKAS